jgi:hypothetical protein
MLDYWRSVGNSLNDFFYESFLDELPTRVATTCSNCAAPIDCGFSHVV